MSINTSETDNLGGIQKIYPIPASNVRVFGAIFNSEIHSFTVTSGTDLTPIYVIRDSIKFTQDHKPSDSGDYFDTKFEAVAPKDRIELQNFIRTLEFTHYILVFKDNNNQFKVMGTPDEPLIVSADLTTGDIESKMNGYTLTFSRKLRDRSPFSSALPLVADPD